MEVAYNTDFGGFSLSPAQLIRYNELSGKNIKYSGEIEENRTDPVLIQVIKEIPKKPLKIRDIPKGSEYRIDEYDGFERVVLKDEYHWSIAE